MKFLRITDMDDNRRAININQIIELREHDNLHTVIVTASENIFYHSDLDETIDMIEKFSKHAQ